MSRYPALAADALGPVGCYTLHLYCNAEGCDASYVSVDPDQTYRESARTALAVGWLLPVNPTSKIPVLCPKCNPRWKEDT
jgi:hypothetical protein